MNTHFIFLGQYDGMAVIPLDRVCRDYFPNIKQSVLERKIVLGEIRLPLVRMDHTSQKTAKGIHLNDLAEFIDARRAAAQKELETMLR